MQTDTPLKPLGIHTTVSMQFGTWYDRKNGNTYYDCEVNIGNEHFKVPAAYGSLAGSVQSINEALAYCGCMVTTERCTTFLSIQDVFQHVYQTRKLKRELFKGDDV